MAFTPVSSDLGTLYENVTFSHNITYKIPADPLAMTPEIDCFVRITPLEDNPSTISITSGGITSSISGYYFSSFDGSSIVYRTKTGQFITVSSFDEIDRSILSQIITFTASTQKTKVFNYTAEAIHPDTSEVVETLTYTKTVKNNWDIGKNQLIAYVGYTI